MPHNNAKPMAVLFGIIAAAGICLTVISIFSKSGAAEIFISVLFVTGFGTYLSQAIRLSRLFKGKDLLVHWTYTDAEYIVYAKKASDERKRGRIFCWIIAAIFIAIAVYIAATDIARSKTSAEHIIYFFILVPIIIATILASARADSHIQKAVKEAYIGMNCAWVMGDYVDWATSDVRLADIRMEKTSPETAEVVIRYMTTGRYKHSRTLMIPVPKGEEAAAINTVNLIRAENRFPELE